MFNVMHKGRSAVFSVSTSVTGVVMLWIVLLFL